MEVSALTTASNTGVLTRSTPLLRLQGDERLVAMIRDGHDRAFEVLFDRYQSRLLAFCRHMVHSPQDAEDVLQEVFAAAHAAMLADNRPINARPWLYRIARNRCLNHLRKPTADGVDSMDVHPHENGATTFERVQGREELRAIVSDVSELPETQRTALVLREIDDLNYSDIALAMGTSLPAVKSLLVRARMSLAEASEARVLTCDEVRLAARRGGRGPRVRRRARPAATSKIASPAAATAGSFARAPRRSGAHGAVRTFGAVAKGDRGHQDRRQRFDRRRIGHGRRTGHGRRRQHGGRRRGHHRRGRHGRWRSGSGRRHRRHARRRGRRDRRRCRWHRRSAGRKGRSRFRAPPRCLPPEPRASTTMKGAGERAAAPIASAVGVSQARGILATGTQTILSTPSPDRPADPQPRPASARAGVHPGAAARARAGASAARRSGAAGRPARPCYGSSASAARR